MNKIYKHIWSKSSNCMIVVGEGVKGSQGKKSGRRKLATALISSITLGSPALAQSVLPTGGQVVAGQASIASNGSAMTIRQATDKAILNWQSFSIGKDAAVTFVQPSASSVALNRVVGQSASEIFGTLNANGQVFLVNPNGVLIGRSGSVQTGAFVASTLGLADQDFLAGKYQFSGAGRAIVNQGSITGSVVALIAPVVTNEGSIHGNTALAGGTDALLDFDGDGLLSVQVKASTLATLVDNQGLIQADGGKVILTAKGASDALQGVVSNSGTIQAHTLASKDGRILLLGDMEHGAVNVSGTLDASAAQGGDGGFIETSAAHVKVADSARITTLAASGKSGTWLIDPNDFTIAASGGDMTGSAVTAALASGDLSIATATQGTAGGNGDIKVNDTVTWSANKLTLSAERNIAINAAMNGSGTAGLALEYGLGAVANNNTAFYTVAAPVNLASGGSFSTKLGSDGTVKNYTIVTSLGTSTSSADGTLQGFQGDVAKNFVLGADIDASSTSSWNGGAGFTPIGDDNARSPRYSGTFDGLGHVISGLTINRPTAQRQALIGYLDAGAVVRNVGVIGGSVSGLARVGMLVGGSNGTLSGSYATGSVTATGSGGAGGLVGRNFGGVIMSYAAVNVTAPGNFDVGGLVGYMNGGNITNSYATGSVSGGGNVGGLLGTFNAGTFSNNYATGAATSTGSVGGLIGAANSGIGSGNYWDTTTSGLSNACGSGTCTTATGLNTSAMKDPFTFINAGWDFGSIWGLSKSGANNGYLVSRASNTSVYDDYVTLSNTNSSKTYGDANPSLGGITLSGVGTSNVTLGWGSAIAPTTDAGTYAYSGSNVLSVTDTDSRSAYVAYGSGALTIGQAALTATASNASKTYNGLAYSGGNGLTYSGFVNGETAGVLSGTASFGGTSQGAVNAGNYTLTASGLSSGNYNISYADGALTVGKAALSITATNASKTYDKVAFSGGNGLTYSGFVNGETAGVLSGTASFGGTSQGAVNAGNYTLTASGLSSGNYNIAYADGALSVNKATITGVTGFTANNKTYDGTTAATLNTASVSLTGVVAGDSLSVLTGSGAFTDKNVGTGKTVNVTGLTFGGADAGNYTFAATTATATADISKAALTVTASNASKTYDGLAYSGGNGLTYSGFVNGETAGVLSGTASFGGTSQGAVNAGNYTLTASGLSSGNYDIAYANGALTVGKAALTVTAANASKTYDKVAYSGGNGLTYSGFVNGETAGVLSGTASFGGTSQGAVNAGNYTLTASGLSSGNYNIAYADGALSVNKATITGVTGFTANNKTYDGTTAATLNTASASLTGVVAGDSLSVLTGSGAFTDKSAGTGKTVNVTGLTFGGADAGNYTFATTTATATADISKAALTATASNTSKTYDGLAYSGGNGLTYSGFVNGETAAVLSGTASFGGTAQGAVNAGNYTLTASGLSSGNYNIAYANGALTVGKAALTATAANASKTYDGLAYSGGNGLTYSGFVNGETAAVLSGTASFGGTSQGAVNAGNYTLTASGLSSGNYNIAYANGALTIGKAALTATPGNASKTYDGLAFSGGNGLTYSGFVNGETAAVLSGTASFGGTSQGAVNAGNYTLTASGLSSGNYNIAYADGALAVNKATITGVGITANNKTYDGTTAATLNTASASFTGKVAGDNLSLATATGAFTDKNAGTGKTVNVTGLTLDGASAGNYTLAATTATTTADISKAAISQVTGITAANKDFDGLTVATLNTGGAAFTGMIAGDSLNVAAAAGNFNDASVGVNKTVLITGLALGGGDANNYALANTSGTTTASIAAVVGMTPPLSPQQIAAGSTSTIGGGTFGAPASAILSAGTEPLVAVMLEGESKAHVSLTCREENNQSCSVR